jgi:hypothetical protein
MTTIDYGRIYKDIMSLDPNNSTTITEADPTPGPSDLKMKRKKLLFIRELLLLCCDE